ncbi:MAG: hypothetical protein JST87_00765 [Bacteroidetes bacterium]|nr:hypothetical protein [Bacteroidota bacterium]
MCLFICGAFALFFPVLNNSFLSDDFMVMKRVGIDKSIIIKGFFRPLSDITLYLNYMIGGFHPLGYYIFNIALHGANSFLLCRFCMNWNWADNAGKQQVLAIIASILFLTYPFHNESIVWIVGRASLIGNFFGFLSLVFLTGKLPEKTKIFFVCASYFIGLASYESIIVFPAIGLLFIYTGKRNLRECSIWAFWFSLTLLIHLIVRIWVSGSVMGEYGSGVASGRYIAYFLNIFKVMGRLFLPPVEDSKSLSVYFVVLLVFLSAILYLVCKKYRQDSSGKSLFYKLFLMLAVACVIPVIFAVSTKTSESDRFLYYPSFFFCGCISFIVVGLVANRVLLLFITVGLLSYNIFFLEKNNLNWIEASRIVNNIITTIKEKNNSGKIYVVNIPDEMDGAYIFRQGFNDALIINQMDTSQINAVNHLKREQMLLLPKNIVPLEENNELKIPPQVTIKNNTLLSMPIPPDEKPSSFYTIDPDDIIFYWNKNKLVLL